MIHNFKIVLIGVSPKEYRSHPKPFMGILSLASYLTQKKIIPRKNIIILDPLVHDPVDYIKDFKPDLVGISSLTLSQPEAVNLAKRTKKTSEAIIVIGGIHVSALPNSVNNPFDVGVIGEGEETFLELVRLFSKDKNPSPEKLKKVKGIAFRNKGGLLVVTPKRPPINPLDKIPFLDWSLLPEIYFRYETIKVNGVWKVMKVAWVFTSRGCPYNCIFCCRSVLWPGVRFFSTKRVAEEVERLVRRYHVEAIRFADDTFAVSSKSRIKALIKELKKRNLLGKVIFYLISARTDNLDEEKLELLKELGIKELFFGFESGSERMLKFLKNDKKLTIADSKKAVNLVEKIGGVSIVGSFMLGSPGETKKDIEKTLNFTKWLATKDFVDNFEVYATLPLPGTLLWQQAIEKKIVSNEMNWKQFSQTRKNPQFFFCDRVSKKYLLKVWHKIEKLSIEHRKKSKQGTVWQKATEVAEKKNTYLMRTHFFSFLFFNLKMSRFGFLARRFIRKTPQHLISKEKLIRDLKDLKMFLIFK